MLRWLAVVTFLSIPLACPASAQQLTEQNARQIAEKVVDALSKAWHDKDANEMGVLFAEDAIRLTPGASMQGRAAIEKWYTGAMADKAWSGITEKLDRVKVVSDNVMLLTGMWSGTWNSPKGPVQMKGGWGATEVRQGDTWKIVLGVVNQAPQE